MHQAVSRRRLLASAGLGVGTLAGCLRETPRRTSRAILLTNVTDDPFTVTLRVYALPAATAGTATDGSTTATGLEPPTDELEQVVRRREDTPPGEGFGVGAEALPAGDLRVRVTTTAGQSDAYDWARLDRRSTLDVRVEPNAVRFTEVD